MCGRYTQTHSGTDLAKAFQLTTEPEPPPRYNIAPAQPVSAIIAGREYRIFQWGLVPSWAKDYKIGYKLINARSETAAEKPSFRAAFKRRRCLIPADGFYEWLRTASNKKKQPFYIHLRDRPLFAFGGLWEQWEGGDGSYLETCTILTTEPNELMEPIHNRMPVIIPEAEYDRWLTASPFQAKGLMKPYDADEMEAYPVSTLVNSPRNEVPDCIAPMES
ncbi:SOS response-associated peptidase [Leptothoe spongobia]|uniref:Abasic site processing protein n=1 Tax=Leptothoe spongobia TAU-MAC 1115 TaxID=1967444 RepID=A0A947GJU9_9CYAN|nr:SOS response-associated peptidase [Leptothoe spongobia]MBT9316824.1 SOS response-associated peptidase [Leptothoe spongobia TAU-MAC 1115]